MHVPLHFAERAFALHLLLQGFQRLVDIIVADENLNDDQFSGASSGARSRKPRMRFRVRE